MRHRDGLPAQLVLRSPRDSEYGGSEHAESPECTPACSMCSMMPPITTSVAVAQRVDVDLDRVVEEAVEQHRRIVATP